MSDEAKEILSRSLVHQIERLTAERDELRADLVAAKQTNELQHQFAMDQWDSAKSLRALLREARIIVANEDRPRMDASELTARIDTALNKGGGDD